MVAYNSYLNLWPEQTNANLDYEEWNNSLGNPRLCKALLSRLRRKCHTVRSTAPPCACPAAEPPPLNNGLRRMLRYAVRSPNMIW